MDANYADARLEMARAFEEGAIALTGRAARTNDAGTIVPVRVRVTGMGQSPFFMVAVTSEADGTDLIATRVFALDGVIDLLTEGGDLPAVWDAVR